MKSTWIPDTSQYLSLSPFGEQVEDARTPGIKAQLNDSPFHEMPT